MNDDKAKKLPTFEDFLKERHAENFPMLLDDDMPDHFDDWLGTLDGEDYIKYAEAAVTKAYFAGFERARDIALDAITYKPTAGCDDNGHKHD